MDYVKNELAHGEKGHDWWHIYRVLQNARTINQHENGDTLIVELASLLHDIADSKFHHGDESIGPYKAKGWLQSLGLDAGTTDHVIAIIENMSFKSSLGKINFTSKELQIVQDADRLDAIGAIGIARAFHYGGYKNREIYNPDVKPSRNLSKEEYKTSTGPTINHFYEKLLLLKDKMNTQMGKKMAEARHKFMEDYLDQFYKEWQ